MRKILFLTFCGLFAAPLAANAQDSLPAGTGSDVVQRVCTACHGTAEFTMEHHDPAGWGTVVSQMIGEGATATDAEQQTIIDYLSAHFPPPGGAAPAAGATPDAAAAPAAGAAPAPMAPATPAPAQ